MSAPSIVEYREKNTTPDLYSILKIKPDVCEKEDCDKLIEEAYNKMVKKYYPDKHRNESEERQKAISDMYEIITLAYDTLKDKKTRDNYNQRLLLNKQSSADFGRLKKSTSDYYESVDVLPATDQQKLQFKRQMGELNKKHNYDDSLEGAISKKDANKLMEQRLRDREVQDVKYKPEKLFNGSKMNKTDLKKFNEAFDISYNKDADTSIIEHGGAPSAWNDAGSSAGFSSFDNLDNLYVDSGIREDTQRQTFGNVDVMKTQIEKQKKITKKEVAELKGADYVTEHNVLGEEYYTDIKKRLKERKAVGEQVDKMEFNDFKRDDMAGYGIFDQLGINVDSTLELDGTDEDIAERYNRLMKERREELPGKSSSSSKSAKKKSTTRR